MPTIHCEIIKVHFYFKLFVVTKVSTKNLNCFCFKWNPFTVNWFVCVALRFAQPASFTFLYTDFKRGKGTERLHYFQYSFEIELTSFTRNVTSSAKDVNLLV